MVDLMEMLQKVSKFQVYKKGLVESGTFNYYSLSSSLQGSLTFVAVGLCVFWVIFPSTFFYLNLPCDLLCRLQPPWNKWDFVDEGLGFLPLGLFPNSLMQKSD